MDNKTYVDVTDVETARDALEATTGYRGNAELDGDSQDGLFLVELPFDAWETLTHDGWLDIEASSEFPYGVFYRLQAEVLYALDLTA